MALAPSEAKATTADLIDRLITIIFEGRPTVSRDSMCKLHEVARRRQGESLVLAAARGIVERVRPGDTIVVSSGWVIEHWFPHGEICGILAAGTLSRALALGLGARVLFLAEEEVLQVYDAVCRAMGIRPFRASDSFAPPVGIFYDSFPKTDEAGLARARELLGPGAVKAVLTVEKCGRNQRGIYHTGRGTDMSASTARLDLFVEEARRRGVFTVGVGDLGNEIGFGSLREEVRGMYAKAVDCGCPCHAGIGAATETDVVVVSSASNRGGYGLEACLVNLIDQPELMHDGRMEHAIIEAAAGSGAIDSFTVGPTRTDGHGIDAEGSAALVELLRRLIFGERVKFPVYQVRA